jgi:hypothetical protein
MRRGAASQMKSSKDDEENSMLPSIKDIQSLKSRDVAR